MRLFFAYWPSPDKAARIAEWAQQAHTLYGGRIMRTETLHMTLAFLGKASEEQIQTLVQACSQWTLPTGDMLLHEPGCFRHAKVVWVGPGSPEPEEPPPAGLQWLYVAHERLISNLAAAGWNQTETRFRPHVSLLRNAAPPSLSELRAPAVSWTPDRCVLVGSRPSETGSHYTMLAEIPLSNAT